MAVFIATSAGLGVSAVWARSLSWLWIVSALAGSAVLLYAAVLLVIDSRLGVRAVDQEMAAIRREAQLEDLHEGIRRLTDAGPVVDEPTLTRRSDHAHVTDAQSGAEEAA